MSGGTGARVLADLSEEQVLALIVPLLDPGQPPEVLVGPGDDAAVLACAGATVVTTDAMVRDRDWRDDWSTAADVGGKIVAQNLADVAAMGARPTGLVVTLLADRQTPLAWVLDFTRGLSLAARAARCPVLGGDLSSAPTGSLSVSVTAFGALDGVAPVLRSGARAGDRVAVCGTLGQSGAGLLLLEQGRSAADPELVAVHRCPRPPLAAGPAAARAGASAMLDLSDGLLRDGARIAAASGAAIDLSVAALARYAARLAPALGDASAWECVLSGGEEHSLLGCFPPAAALPPEWVTVGRVVAGAGVRLDGQAQTARGWDHFHG